MDRFCVNIILCTLLWIGCSQASCPVGYCSLDGGSNILCNIKADTTCDSQQHCNADGQCYINSDTGSDVTYCNCTIDRYGDSCEWRYNHTVDLFCQNDLDCFSGVCRIFRTDGHNRCVCRPGWRGSRCQLETRTLVTDATWCQNGGTPYRQGESMGCMCTCGFSGKFCTDVQDTVLSHDNCHQAICRGHGKCILDKIVRDRVVCQCADGYVGKYCDDPPSSDTCALNCHNGGSCKDNATCSCECGFFGPLCQYTTDKSAYNYKDWCEAIDYNCHNGGTCNIVDNCRLRCDCRTGFYGNHCEFRHFTPTEPVLTTTTRVPDFVCSNTCENGGVCITDFYNDYKQYCKCTCGFFGDYCQYSSNPTRSDYRDMCYGYHCPEGTYCYLSTDENDCGIRCKLHIQSGGQQSSKDSSMMAIALMTSLPLAVLIILAAGTVFVCNHLRKKRLLSEADARARMGQPMSVWTSQVQPPRYAEVVASSNDAPKPLPTYAEACAKPPSYEEINDA